MRPPRESQNLRLVFEALGDYRAHVVLIGGGAKHLYRELPGFTDLGLVPQATSDIDLALPQRLPVIGGTKLDGALQAHGFIRREFPGADHRIARCSYFLPKIKRGRIRAPRPERDPYVEFLVPLVGSEGPPAQPQHDQLLAQRVKNLDLLLADPVVVRDSVIGEVRIPHPLAFIIQKMVIRQFRRDDAKRIRDQGDLMFVMACLNKAWRTWREARVRWSSKSPAWKKCIDDALVSARELYRTPQSPGPVEVAKVLQPIRGDEAARIMADFLAEIDRRGGSHLFVGM